MKILIMGLPNSGKTTLAKALSKELDAPHINADEIRSLYNDWDFSLEGRIRQSKRISTLADKSLLKSKYVICDFVCPTKETKDAFGDAFVIWMNTIKHSKYEDTNKIFEQPTKVDVCIFGGLTIKQEVEIIMEFLNGTFCKSN
mgnify:CR=1 FL=1